MANTLASATLDLARLIGDVVDGVMTAAGGSGPSTTVLDSSFGKRDYSGAFSSADYYNYGNIWFIEGSSTAGDLSNGLTRIITDFASSTSCTFTFDSVLGVTETNETYAVMESIWPRYKLRAFVNLSLQGIRAMPALDTSLTTTANPPPHRRTGWGLRPPGPLERRPRHRHLYIRPPSGRVQLPRLSPGAVTLVRWGRRL